MIELQNFIAHLSRHGRTRWPNRRKNMKWWRLTMPIFSARWARREKHTLWKAGCAKNVTVDCGCAAPAHKSASLRHLFSAHVAEPADAYGSGPYGATRGGSSPLVSKD